jgi:predicted esterase
MQAQTPFSPDELQRRTFRYFWDLTDAHHQVPDRWPNLSFSSIAATGFGLSAWLVGVERGYITRAEAAEKVLNTLKTLYALPQGPEVAGMGGYKGFFYHFLDHQNALRYKDVELSTIDSGLLLAGILSAQSYFDQNTPLEADIRATADAIYRRVDWTWMLNDNLRLSMGWKPERGFLQAEWFGYTEAMVLYVLALGSPTHSIPAASWEAFTQNYHWDTYEGQTHVNFGPLFGHQYSQVWIDFKGIQDGYMRKKGIDYAENSRRATLANYQYCVKNPGKYQGYSAQCWGLTACDGPMDWIYKQGQKDCGLADAGFMGYSARGAATDYRTDDGTIAPTAAGGSMPFAPEICLPALEHMWNTYYDSLVGPYGFKDAFNLDFTACGALPGGWFDQDYLGIDQGPILLMMENYRSGFLWNLMKKNPYIRRGLERAGFSGGWLGAGAGRQTAQDHLIPTNPEVPTNPYFYFDRATYRKNAENALGYRLMKPCNGLKTNEVAGVVADTAGRLFFKNPKGKKIELQLPLVVFLHGSGERGADNEAQLRNGVLAFCEPAQWKKNPCFVLAPQCPAEQRWAGGSKAGSVFTPTPQPAMDLLIELIEKTIRENPAIDPDRVYLSGLSMGGFGTFDLLARRPDLFAAAMPLCGGGDPEKVASFKQVPLWIFHGARDEVVIPKFSRDMVAALKKAGAPPRYTEYSTLGHGIWQETFYNPAVMEWLFSQKRKKVR